MYDEVPLSTIIEVLNDRFGTSFTQADQLFSDQIEHDLASNTALAQQAQSNSIDNFRFPFNDLFITSVIDRMELNQGMTDRIMNEDAFADIVRDLLLQKVYTKLHNQ